MQTSYEISKMISSVMRNMYTRKHHAECVLCRGKAGHKPRTQAVYEDHHFFYCGSEGADI